MGDVRIFALITNHRPVLLLMGGSVRVRGAVQHRPPLCSFVIPDQEKQATDVRLLNRLLECDLRGQGPALLLCS